MTSRNLSAEIHDYLTAHGAATATEIALGVRARRSEVVAALASAAFSRAARPEGANPRSEFFVASRPVPARQSGTDAAPSQNARILLVLRDGLPHTTAAIHAVAGFSRLNSRVAEMRAKGYVIECARVEGVPAGPHAQTYRLTATPDGPLSVAA